MDERLISDDELDALLSERDPLNMTALNGRELKVVLALARLGRDVAEASDLAPAAASIRHSQAWRRLVGFAAAGAGIVAAVLVGVSLLGGGAGRSLLSMVQLPVAQAALLDRIAEATAAGPSAGHGKWLYVELTGTEHQGVQVRSSPVVSYSVTERVQEWSASAHGPTRVRVTFSDFAFASAHARRVYESHRALFSAALAPLPLAAGRAAVLDGTTRRGVGVSPTDIGNGSNAKVPLSSLPSDQVALVTFLGRENLKGFHPGTMRLTRFPRQFVTDNQAVGEWIGLSQILIASTSAQQRAEAYRALTLVRFVHVVGERQDSRGRLGIAVSFHLPGTGPTPTLIIDPRTGDLLQDDNGSGSVVVWLARASVGSDTTLPGGATQAQPHNASPPFSIFRATTLGLLP